MFCIQHHKHWHTVVSASWNWRSLTESWATVGNLWVSLEPNIRWHYEVLLWLSQSDVDKLLHFRQHVSVVLPVEHHGKLFHCAIIWSRNNTITTKNVSSFYTMEHLRWLLCNWLWDICTIKKILVVEIKVSLPIVKCLCHFFVNTGFKVLCLNIHFFT